MITHLNRLYDKRMFTERVANAYAGSDFHNLGYWRNATASRREACRNLMEKLVRLAPKRLRAPRRSCLDVACGKGASTRYLGRFYMPENITGINISEKQLERCRQNAPGSQFFLMDATHLDFADNTFDVVICVEAAFHFNTRNDFLQEALRVLKPRGRLILSDILVTRQHEKIAKTRVLANYVQNPWQYRANLRAVGFRNIEIVDATTQCSIRCLNHLLKDSRKQLGRGEINREIFRFRRATVARKLQRTRYYLLVAASKPV